jgi:hypothetical protein
MHMTIRVGTSGWSNGHWSGGLYPERVANGRGFDFYTELLKTVRICVLDGTPGHLRDVSTVPHFIGHRRKLNTAPGLIAGTIHSVSLFFNQDYADHAPDAVIALSWLV